MPCIRLCVPRRTVEPVLPGKLSHLGIGKVVVDVGHLLRERILGPQPLRPAKIRNAGIGGDACAAEDDDALSVIDPASNFVDHGIWILPPGPMPPVGGRPPCGMTICDAAWRRSSCSSFTVRSIASFASGPNFSAASPSEPAPISKPIGSAPAGVRTCVSPM